MLDPYYQPTETGDTAFAVEASKMKFGRGVLQEIGADARVLGMKRVALFTDPAVAKINAVDIVRETLKKAGLDVVVYDQVAVEPTDDSFKQAIDFARDGQFDGYVSVGGGSTMDTCKAANLYATHPDEFLAYVNPPIGAGKPVPGAVRPHIACPTTFGTASESTGLAIFDLLAMEAKTGISSSRIRPSLGLLDPDVLDSLPDNVTSANAFDVLSHAVESYTARPFTKRPKPEDPTFRPLSQGANPYSDFACLQAIKLVGEHLIETINDPTNRDSREALMFAGMLAGAGFGNAGCHLPHGMSYSVSGLVRDYRPAGYPSNKPIVPHGMSVIVNSPAVFRFTGPACPDRHRNAAAHLGADVAGVSDEQSGAVLADRIIAMMQQTGMPNGLSGVGYGSEDIPALVEGAFPQQRLLKNAPLDVSKEQLGQLYRDALTYW